MDFNTFQTNALVTESKPEAIQVNPEAFFLALNLAYQTALLLDLFKKAAFYGKKPDPDAVAERLTIIAGISSMMGETVNEWNDDLDASLGIDMFDSDDGSKKPVDLTGVDIRVLHAAVGAFTEAGEVVGAALDSLVSGKPIDRVNVGEEFADIDWYKAIAFDALNLSEPETRAAVIAKLRARYPNKFSNESATTRDTAAERAILEQGIK